MEFTEMRSAIALALLAIFLLNTSQAPKHAGPSVVCEKREIFVVHNVAFFSTFSDTQAFWFSAGLAIDADGAFRSYHPHDRLGLDALAHAGHPGEWWALVTDNLRESGRPVLQGKSDPAPGYYVSMTSLFDSTNPNPRDPHRYVDAVKIPYVVLPPEGFRHARLGDFATVVNLRNGKISAALVADQSAPELSVGEGSIALADALGVDSDPRYGGKDKGISFVIYPGSGNGQPRTLEDISVNSKRLFEAWGGLDKLNSCLATSSDSPGGGRAVR
jgi:hypothetical protein